MKCNSDFRETSKSQCWCDSIKMLYLPITGHTVSLDICSLWSDNKHIRFTFSLAYGFLGDVLKTSEQNRWMGPKRYKWGAARRLWKLRYYCVFTLLGPKIRQTDRC